MTHSHNISAAPPNLRHLQAFLEIAAARSVRAAATQANLTQPALTQALAGLEGRLSVRLFERMAAGVRLTREGELFAERVSRALKILRSGEALLARAGAASGVLLRHATTTQLVALAAVVEARSFTGAARSLGVSEPSVHRAARTLERTVGIPLFRSAPEGVEPTQEAQSLARTAALAFEEIRQGETELRESFGKMDGLLRIGSLPLGRSRIVPQAVLALKLAYPDIRMEIHDGSYAELLNHLRHGRLDVIFGALRFPLTDRDVAQEILFDDALSILVRAGHPLAGKATPKMRTLSQLTWIVPRQSTPGRDSFVRLFEERNLAAPVNVIECSSLAAIRSMLSGSDFAALLSVRQAEDDIATGRLAVCGPPILASSRPIGLATRQSWAPTRSQSLLLAALRRAAGVA